MLELPPLSGDHSGKASGKLIFEALRRRGIETKLSKPSIIYGDQIDVYLFLQVQTALTMLPATGHSIALSASVFKKLVISTSIP